MKCNQGGGRARQDNLQTACHMIATLEFLNQRLTCRASLDAPTLRCDPCFRLSLFFSKASRSLVLITAHAVVYVLVARRTYVRET